MRRMHFCPGLYGNIMFRGGAQGSQKCVPNQQIPKRKTEKFLTTIILVHTRLMLMVVIVMLVFAKSSFWQRLILAVAD